MYALHWTLSKHSLAQWIAPYRSVLVSSTDPVVSGSSHSFILLYSAFPRIRTTWSWSRNRSRFPAPKAPPGVRIVDLDVTVPQVIISGILMRLCCKSSLSQSLLSTHDDFVVNVLTCSGV